MSTIQNLRDKSPQTSFDKKVLSATQHLHPYVKHRLYIAESTGIIPKNMYCSNGIIDDSIVKLYENGFNVDTDAMEIKLKLFKYVDTDLDELLKKEAFHKNTVSTNSILKEELDGLEENYTIDADLDYVMNEELNDISYQQDNVHKHLFLYDDNDSSVLKAFEIENLSSLESKKLLGNFYSWLPLKVSNIIDLYVFGKLDFEEISRLKKIETKRIDRIFNAVKKSFRKNLG